MLYVVIILVTLVVAVLLLHVRLRGEYSESSRWLFAGLGRSGVRVEFAADTIQVQLFGWTIRSSSMTGPSRDKKTAKKPRPETALSKPARRRPPVREMLKLLVHSRVALWKYTTGMLKAIVVEQLEAEIRGGFDQPDATGRAFGYYQAALGAAPGVMSHIRYYPDWTEASFSGSARGSVSIPLYQIIGRSMLLLARLPLREIYRVAIRQDKGGQDAQ